MLEQPPFETREESPGSLHQILVVDFSRIVSGPFASQILGDLGADVIKIEFIGIGDEVRGYGLDEDDDEYDPATNPGPTFLAMNRNKRSMALDVRTEAGRAIALDLMGAADVVLHNFRPGVVDRLGLAYEDVVERNPGVIYCSISGFGSVGPLREMGANDLVIQAHSGLLSFTGLPTSEEPVRNPTPVCDMTAGLYATIGILAALHHRNRTGAGQEIETSMLESQLNLQNYILVDYWLNGVVPAKLGSGNRMGQPNQAFQARDGWFCMVAPSETGWSRACEALDLDELIADERFRTLARRHQHRDELVDEISKKTRTLTTEECVRRLRDAGIPTAPINTLPDLSTDPQFLALGEAGAVVDMPVGTLGDVKLVMSPLKLSRTPVSARMPPPALGEHTRGILKSIGLADDEIKSLERDRVVGVTTHEAEPH